LSRVPAPIPTNRRACCGAFPVDEPPPNDSPDEPAVQRQLHFPSGQSAEEKIGPYELQDFNLYYISRFGFRPSKVAFLYHSAWGDKARGDWPDVLPVEKRNQYDLATIKKWLEVFLYRFFKTSQFKRSCLPNGPKVGSGGSLSSRGDWHAPSDSEAVIWPDELRRNVPG
jgi:NAD+ synthase (glutamine-hydrolysing)